MKRVSSTTWSFTGNKRTGRRLLITIYEERMEKEYLWWHQAVRVGICLLIGFLPLGMTAQEEVKHGLRDSVRTEMEIQAEQPLPAPYGETLLPNKKLPEVSFPRPVNSDSLLRIPLEKPLVHPYYLNPSPMFKGDYSIGGVLHTYSNGAFYGSGGQTTLPGIGLMNEASLGYIHQFNSQWSVQMDISALKMSIPFAVGQSFGTSGALIYRPSERVAFKVFGSYYRGQTYGMESHSYGATMKVGVTDRFSMEMGVARHYNPLRGGWETVPVAVPSYKFNKFELGIDVGGILYEILHNVVINNNRGNPTLGPGAGAFPMRGK